MFPPIFIWVSLCASQVHLVRILLQSVLQLAGTFAKKMKKDFHEVLPAPVVTWKPYQLF
jgi:hypothetical protein